MPGQALLPPHWSGLRASGVPDHIRSDNRPELTAKRVREWLGHLGVKTLFVEPGSPSENGYIESFNSKLRDELLKVGLFDGLTEAQVLTERWRRHYNTVRPHSSLDYRPPAPGSHPANPWDCRWYRSWG
jgi:putative transposase